MDDYKPISQQELDRAYFFVAHRLLFKKILFLLVILAIVSLYGILIFKLFNYFRGPSFKEVASRIENSTFNWSDYHAQRAPQALILSKPQFNSLGDRRYNITALVENPNEDWAIKSIKYHFVSQGEDLPTKISFINPKEKRLFVLMAYQSNKAIRNPELVISDIEWYRVNNSFPQIDIQVSDIKFQAATRETIDGATTELPSRVSWSAYNNSLYNFWELDWQIVLYNGNTLVAMNELKSKDFLALETRNLETVWLDRLPRVTRANIFPILNKLDPNIFKDIYVEPTIDSR